MDKLEFAEGAIIGLGLFKAVEIIADIFTWVYV